MTAEYIEQSQPIAFTDEQIIGQHAPGIRARARLELAIVNALIAEAAKQGETLEVHITGEGVYNDGDPYDVKTALFDLDDALVFIGELGWVRLVFGNSGWDLISDYSLTCEEFLRPVLKLSQDLEDQA